MRKLILEDALRGRNGATNHARVVEELGKDIVSGHFKSGELLPGDADLAKRFQVSRTVLREALKTLDAKGLISPRVRVGTSVRARKDWNHFDPEVLLWYIETGVDAELLCQLQEIRLALEPRAAALAAVSADRATASTICDMIDGLLSSVLAADQVVSLMLDVHVAVADASENVFIQSSEALLKAALIGAFRYDPNCLDNFSTGLAPSYRALSDAIRRKDGVGAAKAMEATLLHIRADDTGTSAVRA